MSQPPREPQHRESGRNRRAHEQQPKPDRVHVAFLWLEWTLVSAMAPDNVVVDESRRPAPGGRRDASRPASLELDPAL